MKGEARDFEQVELTLMLQKARFSLHLSSDHSATDRIDKELKQDILK